VTEPPYVDKLAEQRAVLASGRSTEVSYESLFNNGLTMMAEYQLQHQDPQDITFSSDSKAPMSIEFGGTNLDL
jgi:CRISPR/Cas system-associated protein Csm6